MNKRFKFRFQHEYFLFLLPLFFVLHGFTEYFPAIPLQDSILLFSCYLIAIVLVVLLLTFLFSSFRKAAVFSFSLFAINFFFGAVHDFSKKLIGHSFLIQYSFLAPIIILLIIVAYICFKKSKQTFNRLTKYLNILFALFLLFDIALLTYKSAFKITKPSPITISCTDCAKPDIYLIIADEYAGTQELNDLFQFDNRPFEDSLTKKGFHLIKTPKSNYNYTPFSMASMLSMNFLPPMKSEKINDEEINHCTNTINAAPVIKAFKDLGYVIDNNSIFDIDNIPTKVETRFFHKKIKLISGQTLLSRIKRDLSFNLITRFKMRSEMKRVANEQLNDLNFIYNNALKTINTESTPHFVYTHLMMPHYPYFFNAEGKMNDVLILMEGEQIRAKEYLAYLKYCNHLFLRLIDEIQHRSKQPPIILFMSDHGFREFVEPVDEAYHFMNINAVFFPNQNYQGFYDGMSNVNQFRVLFNNQFQQHLPLLKDSTIFLRE